MRFVFDAELQHVGKVTLNYKIATAVEEKKELTFSNDGTRGMRYADEVTQCEFATAK